ncbi:hypothetical protein POF50_016950 [Streptomyces sp. SL13]|uniref:Secreted protein n=1 Tax=Streptantibioticus silvisoli TaxID=2705255 RepID=A0AA90KGU8_9ACTN|nr:hypothetical protein [Streptantibioticus silvisoli]MDI5971010.1 hypothetical protein [Streptantibioticus silvisoli]
MLRGLAHGAAWTLATSTAVALSWFGVHTVLTGTVDDPPRALPLSTAPSPPPRTSSTSRPRPPAPGTSAAVPSRGGPSGTASAGTGPQQPPGTARPVPNAAGATGDVHSYLVSGGRVVLDLGPAAASFVSATPDTGWSTRVWKQPGWIRVDFTSGLHTSSVFCTWNGHSPTVQTYGT